MSCYRFKEWEPRVDGDAYVAPGSTVIGWVSLASRSSVWPGAVIRGDNEPITVGEGSNIQDGAVLHTDPGCPLTIGRDVTVGHQAMLHGCTVEDGALVGIQAVVLNKAVIGRNSLVGAGAVVTEGKVFPERSLILGAPAKVVRTLTDEEVANMHTNAKVYVARAAEYKAHLAPL
ncbi:MAG TPA: gamma carbonic anhydrase family protein [Burkholderiaceae bacterium]|nr:gamma carbonic anhydrase family protein [Burkholderiaceae bacterium]